MARSIGDIATYPMRSPQANLVTMPFQLTFTGGTISASVLPPWMVFQSKTTTGTYRFKIPSAVATKFWADADTSSNTIVTFPLRDTLVPTGLIDIQLGTTTLTTATDPADGTVLYGVFHAGWGK